MGPNRIARVKIWLQKSWQIALSVRQYSSHCSVGSKTSLCQQRARPLKKLIVETGVQYSESFQADGREMFKHACGIGLEGVVSKVRDSRYTSGRGNDWVKKTCAQRETAGRLINPGLPPGMRQVSRLSFA